LLTQFLLTRNDFAATLNEIGRLIYGLDKDNFVDLPVPKSTIQNTFIFLCYML